MQNSNEKYQNDIAIVLGNGPSVDQLNPALLDGIRVFGTNSIFKKYSDWRRSLSDVVITDFFRLHEIGSAYAAFPETRLHIGVHPAILPRASLIKSIVKRDFIPIRQYARPFFRRIKTFQHVHWSDRMRAIVFDKLQFSLDPEVGFNFGRSVVTASIAIAAQFKPKRILISGIDARYRSGQDYFSGMSVDYVNHDFIKNPRAQMEPFLAMARVALEDRGIELIDCTPSGAITCLRKSSFEAEISK